MKIRIVQTVLVIFLVHGFSGTVLAQTLNNILNKLQILETRLEQIETKPQSDFTNKIETVEVRLATFETRNEEDFWGFA